MVEEIEKEERIGVRGDKFTFEHAESGRNNSKECWS